MQEITLIINCLSLSVYVEKAQEKEMRRLKEGNGVCVCVEVYVKEKGKRRRMTLRKEISLVTRIGGRRRENALVSPEDGVSSLPP